MDEQFWHGRWQNLEIGFHLSEVNPMLVRHFDALKLKKSARLFVPLCGKSEDIGWFLKNGYEVAGAELSETAITQLFDELGIEPIIEHTGQLKIYKAESLVIYVGNIFDLSAQILGSIDAIYDRAALVALPQPLRNQYTAHLRALSLNAPQLLICFEYEQPAMEGPPFNVDANEVKSQYETAYHVHLLERNAVEGGLRGTIPAHEAVWLLKPIALGVEK
ncbi:MAG: thiopurine S-methyltransferase [Alphaproteobacteria bacterium]|nr:thiopurine S-methyltransferase [Alphaproteobacteria bacterium]MDE2043016.1 thiopurine S-methyltransferase [Alphaproteobacteria bacterium]MDE2339739.1 thiopurine S-methyltransferase [Alphaproteobacteria bacterium]